MSSSASHPAITIRRATVADIERIRRVACVAFPATYAELITPGQLSFMMDWMYSPESLRQQMEREGHVYFLAERGGEPCGYVSVQPEGQAAFHLQKIYVLPTMQRCGLGARLLRTALDYAQQAAGGPCHVELNVNRQNPAVAFYERMGLSRLRTVDNPIGHGYFMNDYIMGIDLPAGPADDGAA